MTNEELILLKSEMDNLKNTVNEMKKEIKIIMVLVHK